MKSLSLLTLSAGAFLAASAAFAADQHVERGKYLVTIGGCNNCHTASSRSDRTTTLIWGSSIYQSAHKDHLGESSAMRSLAVFAIARPALKSNALIATMTPTFRIGAKTT